MGAENSKGHSSTSQGSVPPPSRRAATATGGGGGGGAPATAVAVSPNRHADPNTSAPCGRPANTAAPTSTTTTTQQQQSATRPIAVGGGSTTNAGTFPASLSFTAASSVPRYVDDHSVVYTSPHTNEIVHASHNNNNNSIAHSTGLAASLSSRGLFPSTGAMDSQPSSQPRLVHPASSTNDFAIGSPATPLSPSRRHVAVLSHSVSTPISIPTYNSVNDDIGTCGSPILKSYRQHSLSVSKGHVARDFVGSPTSPKLVFSGSNPGAFSMGNTQGNVSDSLYSPTALTSMSSQGPSGSNGGDHHGSGSGSGVPIHQRFLEITGYPLGLENYGNTCYCNSVIQLLYHCPPLRLRLLELHDIYHSKKGGAGFEESTLLFHLSSLMAVMHKSNNRKKDARKRELISPSALLKAVKEKNPAFNNNMQQDAHEFAMYILNDIMETESKMMTDPKNRAIFSEESKKKKSGSGLAFWRSSGGGGSSSNNNNNSKHGGSGSAAATSANSGGGGSGGGSFALSPADGGQESGGGGKGNRKGSKKDAGKNIKVPDLSPLQSILQGQFGSMTACLECNHITARDEVFIDLSLETEQGSSLLTCLRHFGDPEYFYGDNRLRCDHCKDKARAAKTIHVQRLPEYALLVHLKRFRYDPAKQNFTKKADHVALPMTMDVEEYRTDPDELGSDSTTNPSTGRQEDGNGGGSGPGNSFYDTHREAFKPADEATKRKLRGVAKHKARFTLSGFVAHLGEGPSLGHYFTCVRYGPQLWRRFDDDVVTLMTEREVEQYFGVPINLSGVVTTTAYILLYERVA